MAGGQHIYEANMKTDLGLTENGSKGWKDLTADMVGAFAVLGLLLLTGFVVNRINVISNGTTDRDRTTLHDGYEDMIGV